jgi:hypothetical protein
MRNSRKLSLLAVVAVVAAFAACGDDENLVRTRSDGGTDASSDAPVEAGPGTLACGVTVATSYESPNFATNAKAELDLKAHVAELEAKMESAEGAGTAVVTSAELQAIFTAGAPNLRSIATAAAQATIDAYITQFGEAVGKTWAPADAEAEGGAPAGGKFANTSIVSAIGVDLREASLKNLLGGAFYNHALAIAGGPITEATIDRLVVSFGATPKFAHRTDRDAGADERDELVAELAAMRDDKASSTLGPYRKVRGALLVAKAAAAGGEKCRADLDDALEVYFLEWEKATYLTVIFYLNQAATDAQAMPVRGPAALRGFAAALGLIQSFRGIPQDRRKINDAQIDALVTRVGGTTAYQLLTRTSERVVAFNTAFQDIGAIFGLTQTQIEDAKKAY